MSKIIANETPTGVIDGVNKTFVFSNKIDYITTLTVDGVEYRDFTVDSNDRTIVYLTDAPILSIYGDYYPYTRTSEVDTDCTLGDMLEEYYNLTGQNVSTSTNLNQTRAIRKMNSFMEKVWLGRVTSILNGTIFRAGRLWFQEDIKGYRYYSGGALTAELNIGDITLDTDTSNLLDSGYVKIGADIIKYTSKSDTQLLGVSGQTTTHLIGDKIQQLYTLPVNFNKPIKVDLIKQNSEGVYQIEVDKYTDDGNYIKYYDIIRVGDDILLELVNFSSDDEFKIIYQKKFTKLNSSSDLCSLPSYYGIDVIATIVAGEHLYQRKMPKGEEILNVGYGYLQNMYQDFNNDKVIIKQSIRPKPYRFRTIR